MLSSLKKQFLFSFLLFLPTLLSAAHNHFSMLLDKHEKKELEHMASRELTEFEYKLALMNNNFYFAAREKQVIIIIGGPGSGKSFFMEKLNEILPEFKLLNKFDSEQYLIVDSHFFREAHHGYNNYLKLLRKNLGTENCDNKKIWHQLKPLKQWKKNAKKRMLNETPLDINMILGKSKKGLKECIKMLRLRAYKNIWFIGLMVPWEIAQNRGFERPRPYRGTRESHDEDTHLVNSLSDQAKFNLHLKALLELEEKELDGLIGRRTVFTNNYELELIYDSEINL